MERVNKVYELKTLRNDKRQLEKNTNQQDQ